MTSVANAVSVSSAKGSGYGTYGCYGVTVNEREHLFACEGLHKSVIIIEPLQNVTEKSTLSSFLPVPSQFILVVQLVLGLGAGSVAVDTFTEDLGCSVSSGQCKCSQVSASEAVSGRRTWY